MALLEKIHGKDFNVDNKQEDSYGNESQRASKIENEIQKIDESLASH